MENPAFTMQLLQMVSPRAAIALVVVMLGSLTLACGPAAPAAPTPVPADPFAIVRATSQAAYTTGKAHLDNGELEAALPSIAVPFGVLVGERSPMPVSAGLDTAARIPGAWSHVVPGAGHMIWHEAPGSLVAAMDRLAGAP